MKSRLFVLVGPSAVGKNAVLSRIRARHPSVAEVISATTRPPRPGETNGVHYRFIDRRAFLSMAESGQLAEWVEFEGYMYGTPIDMLNLTATSVAIVDTVGAVNIKKAMGPRTSTIFIMPPSDACLRERFARRSAYDGEDVERRMERARADMAMADQFDHKVVNDNLDAAAGVVAGIMGLRWPADFIGQSRP